MSNSFFKVSIDDLIFETIIGILPFERITKQKVIVNVSFEYTYDPLSQNFIDYSEVAQLIEDEFQACKFKLIEDALLHFQNLLPKKYPLRNLSLQIIKPDILPNCKVGVGFFH